MTEERAIRFLRQHLGYTVGDAQRVLAHVNAYIATDKLAGEERVLSMAQGVEVHTRRDITRFPESMFASLLLESGETGKVRFQDLIRHDLTLRETPEELDAMLTQAFCGSKE